jgi:hypothetical protein
VFTSILALPFILDDFFKKGDYKWFLTIILGMILILTIFETIRIFLRKEGPLKSHTIKVHEGTFPKP